MQLRSGRIIRRQLIFPPENLTMEANSRTLNDYFAPVTAESPMCITLPTTTAAQFEIRLATINMLPKFHGLDSEQPYIHLGKFLKICNTFKNQSLDDDGVKLRLFPLSLEDKAASWLNSLPPNSIITWEQLTRNVMSKFYPMQKTESMRDAISTFRGEVDEEFHETWELFHDLLLKCPHHGFDIASLVHFLYKGLSLMNRTLLNPCTKANSKTKLLIKPI